MGWQYLQRIQPLGLIFLLCFLMVSCRKEQMEWNRQLMTKIKPSFNKGLESISNLLDAARMYEYDNPPNRAASLALTTSVKHSTQLALDSISEAEKICIAHLKQFNDTLIALSVQISESEKEQERIKANQDHLNAEVKRWEADTEVLREEVANLQEKVQEANQQILQIESKIERMRGERTSWIILSIFTFGLGALPIIDLDKEWNKLANERDGHQARLENRRYQLDKSERMLRDTLNRKFASKQNLETTKIHLLNLKNSLVRLQSQHQSQGNAIDLSQRVKKFHTFLATFNSKLNDVYTQRVQSPLNLLLHSGDNLVNFLGHREIEELVNLIGDEKVVQRIRQQTQPSASNL